jgi:hypothetical protein
MQDQNSKFMELVPEHNARWEKNTEGGVILWTPKFTHPFMVKYILPLFRKKEYKINLDQYGSFVWLHVDGKKSVQQIGSAMYAEFGEKIEPVEQRLGIFINIMSNRNLLVLHEK